MLILASSDNTQHNPQYEFYDGERTPYAEHVDRIENIRRGCEARGMQVENIDQSIENSFLEQIHSPRYVAYLRHKCGELAASQEIISSSYIRDTYSPLVAGTYDAALKSANLAYVGAERLFSGAESAVYALCRPPGHHAEADAMSGYCYINNAAVAARRLAAYGTVAILDIDYHHGNGTQHIFYEDSEVLYASLHAAPEHAFPYSSGFADERGKGAGLGFNRNYPLDSSANSYEYLRTLEAAIAEINEYSPNYLVVSLGYDTYRDDPIAGLSLEIADFNTIGHMLKAQLSYPTLFVQEGGYNVRMLADLSGAFIDGYLAL